ncbi:glycine dehydrogenase [Bacillus anthracis]|nr:glycine dehydrogenase [Bacillus cereus]PDY89529.1 glycine dehydrogenase [Bacillus anthracis]PEY26698.1 glycine dehydrogenase [Bacillus anthracis]PFB57972.1 glycine dehydrogenase [Bacillus anthracis]
MIRIIKKELAAAGSFFVWRICAEIVKEMLKNYIFCFLMV